MRALGLDSDRDDIEELYAKVHDVATVRALVAVRPPADWARVVERVLWWGDLQSQMAARTRSMYGTATWRPSPIHDLPALFALGARLGALEGDVKKLLRKLWLSLPDYESRDLFKLLVDPAHMERGAFIDLIAHPKLAARYKEWSPQIGMKRDIWETLASPPPEIAVPPSVRRMARAKIAPPERRIVPEMSFVEAGEERVLTREELYELVWSEPMRTLAGRFGLSDNGLRKRRRAMNIPWPPRGYWRRVETGKRVGKRPPLPAADGRKGRARK